MAYVVMANIVIAYVVMAYIVRPDLKRESNEQNKRSCKLSCATQLRVWYAVEKKISLRLQFQRGANIWGGRKPIFFDLDEMAPFCLRWNKGTKRNLACTCFFLFFSLSL